MFKGWSAGGSPVVFNDGEAMEVLFKGLSLDVLRKDVRGVASTIDLLHSESFFPGPAVGSRGPSWPNAEFGPGLFGEQFLWPLKHR